jgi:hypothetical protein
MPFGKKVVLHTPSGYRPSLDDMVERFIKDGVALVAVVGEDCARIEGVIDELVVGDGSDDRRFILTSSHPGETVDEVLEFARWLIGDYAGDVELIVLG